MSDFISEKMRIVKLRVDAPTAPIPAVPVPQVDEIEAWAKTEGIWHNFQILPPDNEYRFVDLAPEDPKVEFCTRKPFLDQNPEYKTWALIRMLKGTKRAIQVVFQNVESGTSRTFVKVRPRAATPGDRPIEAHEQRRHVREEPDARGPSEESSSHPRHPSPEMTQQPDDVIDTASVAPEPSQTFSAHSRQPFPAILLPPDAVIDAASDALSVLSVKKHLRGSRDVMTPFAEAINRAKRKTDTPGEAFEAFKMLKGGADMEFARKERLREQISIQAAEQQRLVNELRLAEEKERAYKDAFRDVMKNADGDAVIEWVMQYRGGGGLDMEDMTSMSEMAGNSVAGKGDGDGAEVDEEDDHDDHDDNEDDEVHGEGEEAENNDGERNGDVNGDGMEIDEDI